MVPEVEGRTCRDKVNRTDSVAALLQTLVRIPSVNPDGDPGTERTGELECAEFLGGFLAGLGAEVALRRGAPGSPER